MNKFTNMSHKHRIIIIIPLFVLFFFALIFFIYDNFSGYHFTAKFTESGPLYVNMPVYYKGCKIGKTKKIEISEDYKYTLVKIKLSAKEPKLPENIVAKYKPHNVRKEYIELATIDEPSSELLKNGGTIHGQAPFDIESFLAEISNSGVIVPLLENFSETLVSAGNTSKEIKEFFSESSLILKDNKQNIKQTTKSLNALTTKFNNSITEDKINNVTSNLDKSSENIATATERVKNITANVDCATRNLDSTVAKIDSSVSDANEITSNVKVVTAGLSEVLNKRFAGLRIIFGRPLNSKKVPNKCSK